MTDFERRVYWDGYGLGPKPSGVAVHASNLKKELISLGLDPVIMGRGNSRGFLHTSALWDLKPLHPLRTLFEIRAETKKSHPGKLPVVLHGLSNINLPVFFPWHDQIKSVITVHDLIPYFAQQSVSRAYYLQFSWLLPRVVTAADRIVCVSDWTRATLLERFPGIDKKCVTIKNGCDGIATRFAKDASMATQASAENGKKAIHVLTIGRPEAYKRLDFFTELIRRSKGKITGTLVTSGEGASCVTAANKDLIQKGSLKVLENVPNEQLGYVYEQHDVYVHPSLYEGFCLPAVEALSARIPVLFQKGSGIDEVVWPGCGIGMTKESSEDDWIEAICDLNDIRHSIAFSEALQEFFQKRFTWKQAALEIKNLYNGLLNG